MDVLVNNAGIADFEEGKPSVVDFIRLRKIYETNFFGVVRVTTAFIPLLDLSENPIITNISSGLGSFASQTNPESPYYPVQLAGYNSSKAALNHYTITLAADYKKARV